MRSALKILLCAHQGSIIFNLAPFPVSSSFMFNMKLLWSVSSLVSFWGWQKHLPAVPVASQRSTQTCLKSLKVLSMHCIGKTLTLHCSALKVWCLCEIVHPKNKHFLKMYSPPQVVTSSEQILRNLELHHLLINGSYAVNGCRQNESSNSW